jgi:hypothetical protein
MFKKDVFELLGNKFKYDVNGKCNQQERKVYPQDKYCEHKISYRDVLKLQDKCKIVMLVATWKILRTAQEKSSQVISRNVKS